MQNRTKPGLKTLFVSELKYQFISPTRFFSKLIGILVGTLLLAMQIVFQKDPTTLIAMSSMSMIISIFSVEMGSLVQNIQSIDRLKNKFLIYRSKQVVLIRFLNEIISILLTSLIMFLILAISFTIKFNHSDLGNALQLIGKSAFAILSFGILIAYLWTWASTVSGSSKKRKIVGAFVAGIIYLIVLVISIVFPTNADIRNWFSKNDWFLALPIFGTLLSGIFVSTGVIAWIYAFLSIIYILLLVMVTFKPYSKRIKLSITKN